MMFFMFAMTSDAVGMIIPELINEFNLSMTQASAFHYAPMALIAFSGLFLGFLADSFGRKQTIMLGLGLFTICCFLFAISSSFSIFVVLLSCIGLAIGLFKTGALALLGDISKNNLEHTKTMNLVEGFFGVGAIVGPALVSFLITPKGKLDLPLRYRRGFVFNFNQQLLGVQITLNLKSLKNTQNLPLLQPQ